MKKNWLLFLCITGLVLVGLTITFGKATAQITTIQTKAVAIAQPSNEECLKCHGQPGMQTTLSSGEVLYLTVDADTYNNSVHGAKGIPCVKCHPTINEYPHPPLVAATHRDYTLQQYQTCAQCHQDKFDVATNDAHKQAREAGNQNAAVCTDCHGTHDITPANRPRSRISQTCQRCHSQIFELYKNSVHGKALLGDGNPDVPTCIDCHNAHNVQGPSNTEFLLFSPQICARCHADKQLMDKYGINTDVFNTYIADFHGTTVELFQATAPGQATNKPVCIDCHGVHDMLPPNDPNSTVMKARLLTTCQKCHPDATANFPDAWLNHYRPSPQHNALVYYVNLFYKIFIPTVLGGMGIFVVSDATRRIFNKRRRPQPVVKLPEAKPPLPPLVKPEIKPALKGEAPPEVKIATQPETEFKDKPASQADTQPAAKPAPLPETKPDVQLDEGTPASSEAEPLKGLVQNPTNTPEENKND